ncbi:hypothetical protein WJX84_008314 [Apatococcus fuscideae]|uniref:Uncharacterized protein n=1 Tax=Apatococcus fuscideae TaxID=2026836 RepID=A0AAW1TAI7_9CHLO
MGFVSLQRVDGTASDPRGCCKSFPPENAGRVHQALHRRSDGSEKDLAEVSHSHLSRRSCRGSASYQVGCKRSRRVFTASMAA